MFITTQGYISEFQLEDYLNYAAKKNEIQIVNFGSKKLYQIYLTNLSKNSNNIGLVTDHKSSMDTLLASFGQETLVEVNGKQVRRLVLDINQVNYKELQDKLLGDFVFIYNDNVIIVDCINYEESSPNIITTKYIKNKLRKLKKRCHLYKHIAVETVGKGSKFISVLWNQKSTDDLLESLDNWHKENKYLRSKYKKAKAVEDLTEVAKILTQVHVKTNIDLDQLSFDVTERIY